MWRGIRNFFGDRDGQQQNRRATLEGTNHEWIESHALPLVTPSPAPATADSLSIASNPSMSSSASANSSARRQNHTAIALQYFGPTSQTTLFDLEESERTPVSATSASAGSFFGDQSNRDDDHGSESEDSGLVNLSCGLPHQRDETPAERHARKDNERAFEDLVHLANTKQPVTLGAFKRTSSVAHHTEDHNHDNTDTQLNTELMEAYVAYAHSIGHAPAIEVALGDPQSDDEQDALATERLSYVHERGHVDATTHWGTPYIGTRFSKRRGCVQFWAFLSVGVVVTTVMILFLAQVRLNEVLHLDAFVGHDVVVTDDFAFLHVRDRVGFRLTYAIDAGGRDRTMMVLLLTEANYKRYRKGETFGVITQASRWRTSYASLPLTRIENADHDEMYLVVQPCDLTRGNITLDLCRDGPEIDRLPTPVASSEKLFALRKEPAASPRQLRLRSFYVNPMPDTCAASGWRGAPFILLFLPSVLAVLFGLRVFQMLVHCESFRANLERTYTHERAVPEAEVDYWQPTPWDRKVPKTRLLGPCCWRKLRRPLEPFSTWWRHENYFTWIWFPYRNERLARSERALIIFCSLYITFYVTFLLAMAHHALGDRLPAAVAVAVYWLLLLVLPSLGKALFKEIFKLIFRQRRKYFRLKAVGGDTSGFSFRLAFLLQVLVVLFVVLAQGPLLYMWRFRSCTFLGEFMYFGLLAALARLSLVGLVMDFGWYTVLQTYGHRDLCPHCTERIVDCDCFNDALLVIAVERVGAKWALILLLDGVLSRHAQHAPQFDQYTAEQLCQRWHTLVARAETHVEKVRKLRAYHLQTKREGAKQPNRLSRLVERASFWRPRTRADRGGERGGDGDNFQDPHGQDHDMVDDVVDDVDSIRERKILLLDHKIREGLSFQPTRTTINGLVHSMQHTVHGLSDNAIARDSGPGHATSSMRVELTTASQRLARREDERERRGRAFSVLNGYRIEKRTPDAVLHPPPPLSQANLISEWWRSLGGSGRAWSQGQEPLVPTDADDVVVVVTEDPTLLPTVDEGVEEADATGRVETHTYAVSVREPTWWDATVGRAGALIGWVVQYDSRQY